MSPVISHLEGQLSIPLPLPYMDPEKYSKKFHLCEVWFTQPCTKLRFFHCVNDQTKYSSSERKPWFVEALKRNNLSLTLHVRFSYMNKLMKNIAIACKLTTSNKHRTEQRFPYFFSLSYWIQASHPFLIYNILLFITCNASLCLAFQFF
jgi:hypothetical protein